MIGKLQSKIFVACPLSIQNPPKRHSYIWDAQWLGASVEADHRHWQKHRNQVLSET